MDLDLELIRPSRRAEAVTGTIVRELTEADIALLETDRGIQPVPIKHLRHRHHALARALASGLSNWEAAMIAGYAPHRVAILNDDPTFKELVAFYHQEQAVVHQDLHEKLVGLSQDAADELATRLENEPEKLSTAQLQELVKLGADRTGYGPQSSSTNVNVTVDISKRLEAARKRVNERQLIEGNLNDNSD